jgi:hypothetical protein
MAIHMLADRWHGGVASGYLSRMSDHSDSPDLVLVRDLLFREETRRQHARAAAAGREVRVARGAYVERGRWDALDDLEQAKLRLLAHARTRSGPPVFSHWSAALLHGLPVSRQALASIHVTLPPTSGGRSVPGVVAHCTGIAAVDVVELGSLRCTSIERTVVDLGASASMRDALPSADAALRRGVRKADLLASWLRAQPQRGHRRSLELIEFADGRAESPLESVSRASMRSAGIAAPELQMAFRDAAGLVGYVDFAWPEANVVGEADGDAKYLDPALRNGRSAERVVLDEKIREDRLRALGLRVVRWRWETACEPRALQAVLGSAGVPTTRAAVRDERGLARASNRPKLWH